MHWNGSPFSLKTSDLLSKDAESSLGTTRRRSSAAIRGFSGDVSNIEMLWCPMLPVCKLPVKSRERRRFFFFLFLQVLSKLIWIKGVDDMEVRSNT